MIPNTSVFAQTALIAAFVLAATPSWADCTRHVYNKSENVWAYGFTASADEKLPEDAMRILPGETHKIEYVTGGTTPKWMVTDKITEVSGNGTYWKSFSVEGCYLRHDGVTGRAILNDPADGDIVFVE